LGDAAGGLEWLSVSGRVALLAESGADRGPAGRLVERYLRPMPRVEAGRALVGIASAAIDLSAGLASDLARLCGGSGCGAGVGADALPLSGALEAAFGGADALRLALSGGDDYELCFTAPPDAADRVAQALAQARTPVRRIGRLTDGADIVWQRGGER